MKTCRVCKTEKPLTEYHNCSAKPDGKVNRCKDCSKAARKAFYDANKERTILERIEWGRKNREKAREYRKKEYETNKDRYRAYTKSRKRRVRKHTPSWVTPEHHTQMQAIYDHARECELLTGDKYHVDHIVPLKGENVSGLHVPWNLQVLPADINDAKGNKWCWTNQA